MHKNKLIYTTKEETKEVTEHFKSYLEKMDCENNESWEDIKHWSENDAFKRLLNEERDPKFVLETAEIVKLELERQINPFFEGENPTSVGDFMINGEAEVIFCGDRYKVCVNLYGVYLQPINDENTSCPTQSRDAEIIDTMQDIFHTFYDLLFMDKFGLNIKDEAA